MPTPCRSHARLAACGFLLLAIAAAAPAVADTIAITNRSANDVTLSDLIGFAGPKNTGAKRVYLKPKDASDDVTISKNGGVKNVDIGADKNQSWVISWLNGAGKEVETAGAPPFTFHPNFVAMMFDSPFGGDYALVYGDFFGAFAPVSGTTYTVDAAGHLAGTGWDLLTFYDVTGSADGLVERDSLGNILSPLLPLGTPVTASFEWTAAVVPEPGTVLLFVAGLAGMAANAARRRLSATPRGAP